MKTKTARRFLSRNAWKAAHIRLHAISKKNSFTKHWRECTKIVEKEKRIKNEQKEKGKATKIIKI